MKVILGETKGKSWSLELKDGLALVNGEPEPIKNITEDDLRAFQEEVEAVPKSDDPGYEALVNSIRAAFLAKLLGHAVGDECVSKLQHILDHVHYDVLKYLGEVKEDENFD